MRSKVLGGMGTIALLIVTVLSVTDRARAHTRIATEVAWGGHSGAVSVTGRHSGGIAPDDGAFSVYGTGAMTGAWPWKMAMAEEAAMGRVALENRGTVRPAKNGYHRVEAVMVRPGEARWPMTSLRMVWRN